MKVVVLRFMIRLGSFLTIPTGLYSHCITNQCLTFFYRLQTLVQGLLYCFSNAVRNQLLRESGALRVHNELRPLYNIDVEYAKGCLLSQKLLEISVDELLHKNDPGTFNSLANVLCMHASLDTGHDMKYISEELADRLGYQIGDKIFTYSTIIAYSLAST
jgi:hypothetical protein